jgi:hypothetical protein
LSSVSENEEFAIVKLRLSFVLCALALSIVLGGATSVQAATPATPKASVVPARSWWVPTPGTSWQWQLSGSIDLEVQASVFDIDLFTNDREIVSALHARGSKVICYVEAGAWEPYRPDSGRFPEAVLGNDYEGWPGQRWLDIRRLDVLGPIMRSRLDQCRAKGFDGVEFDNADGYTQDTGFPLSARDQLKFNSFLAGEAHARGLSAGLKNDLDQVAVLVSKFDFAVNEQCFEYSECDALLPFIKAGKAVFNAEYNLEPGDFCADARSMRISSIRKDVSLDAPRVSC